MSSSSPDLPGFAPAVSTTALDSPAPSNAADPSLTEKTTVVAPSPSIPLSTVEEEKTNEKNDITEDIDESTNQPQSQPMPTAQKPKSILRESSIAQKDTQRTDTVMSWIKGPTSKATVKMPPKKPEETTMEQEPTSQPEMETKDVMEDDPDKSAATAVESTIETDNKTNDASESNFPTTSTPVKLPEQKSSAVSSATTTAAMSSTTKNSPAGPRRAKITAAKSVLLKQARKSPVVVAVSTKSNTQNNEKTSRATAKRKKQTKATAMATSSPSSSSRKKPRVSATSSSSSSGKKPPAAKEIWSGVPEENVEGVDWTGWTKKTFERQSGKTKGTTDNYWYTPQEQYKLRSLNEIKRFVSILKKEHGNEQMAWKKFKGK
jgi:hypothetical protein